VCAAALEPTRIIRAVSDTLESGAFDVLTFDCYGTLIDWETGLAAAMREALGEAAAVDADELMERYGRHEAAAEAGPYQRYREILAQGLRGVAAELGLTVTDEVADRFGDSVAAWPPFPDSSAALRRLATRFRLGVLTNCDDDLFAASNARLGVRFDWVVTAQQVRSYKPDEANFRALLERLAADGVTSDRVLHVAQSLYHDHVPAQRLGLRTVWIDRRHGRAGSGATPLAEVTPDATYQSMEAFAAAAVRD
jgi:2-haloacid dehalogenase